MGTYPGIAPYLRGPYPTMYVNQPWTSGSTRASPPPRSPTRSTAATWRPGQKGLSVAFDLPTHRGYDSDHPRVTGDVGMARASPSTPSTTCGSSSTASRWTG
ncbi:methylmalonyl-CoA mutase family protein [Streptomyces thioluteus]|uniref:methylmalonyl-CoA mutase family protein n=1 Tax=Streptomyces thioluteus TaxID=66431 RepID=UPI003CD0A031